MYNLKGLSSIKLRELAYKANRMAEELELEEPSEEMALLNGIIKKDFKPDYGEVVASYSGDVTFIYKGRKWNAIGHGPSGNDYIVTAAGYIEYIPLDCDNY